MLINYYDIDNSMIIGNRFKTQIFIAKLVSRLKTIANTNFKNYVIGRINRKLKTLFIESEGLKKLVLEEGMEQPCLSHSIAKQMLTGYRKTYAAIENSDFFDNEETKIVAEKTLSNFYAIEVHIRMNSDFEPIDDSKNIEFAKNITFSSFSS